MNENTLVFWGNKEFTQKKKSSNENMVFAIKNAIKGFH